MSGGISFAGASGFAITGGNFGRARGDVVTINGGSTELLPFISTTHLIPGLMADIDSTSSQDDDSSGDEDDSSVQNTAFPGSQHPIPPSPSSDNRPTSLVPQTPPNSIASLESVNLLPPPSNTPGVRGLAPARMQTRTLETPPEPQHVRYTEALPRRTEPVAQTLVAYPDEMGYYQTTTSFVPFRNENVLPHIPPTEYPRPPPRSMPTSYGSPVILPHPNILAFSPAVSARAQTLDHIHSRPLPPTPIPPPTPIHTPAGTPVMLQAQRSYWTPTGWARDVRHSGYISSPTIEVGSIPSPGTSSSLRAVMQPHLGFGYWYQPAHFHPYGDPAHAPAPAPTPMHSLDSHAYASVSSWRGGLPQREATSPQPQPNTYDEFGQPSRLYPGYYPRSSGSSTSSLGFGRF